MWLQNIKYNHVNKNYNIKIQLSIHNINFIQWFR